MKISISRHALQQMFRRGISVEELKNALMHGQVLKSYEDDKPYPSKLVLHIQNNIPLHVVYAENPLEKVKIVITAYRPDEDVWDTDFKTKK